MRTWAMVMDTASNMATIASGSVLRSSKRVPKQLLARAGIAAGALLLALVFLPASLASWAEVDHQSFAARIAPWDAPVVADAAAAISHDPRNPRVRLLVRRSLMRDPTQVQAIEL